MIYNMITWSKPWLFVVRPRRLGPGLFLQAQRDETLRLGGDVPPHLAPLPGPPGRMRFGDATNGDLGIYMGYIWDIYGIWEYASDDHMGKLLWP